MEPDSTPESESPGSTSDHDRLADVVDVLESEEYDVERPLPGVLHVRGRFSNPERIALRAAALAGDQAVAAWATSHRDDWVLVAWRRPDLVTVVHRAGVPQRWRHRRLPPTLNPDAQTFLEGASSPFDIVTRPKHQPTPAAREVIAGFGIEEPAPPGWVPPVVEAPEPVVRESRLPAAAAKAPRPKRVATPKPKAEPKPEPVTPICPTCFMALPATGVCDNCG